MSHVIFYYSTLAEAEQICNLFGTPVMSGRSSSRSRKEMLDAFWLVPNGQLAMHYMMGKGFSVPVDTIFITTATVPNGPEKVQALSRPRGSDEKG